MATIAKPLPLRAPGAAQWLPRARLGDTGRTVKLRIPRLRKGNCFPGFLELRLLADRTLTAVIQAYVQGISTRSVDDLVKAVGRSGISKSQVSRLCEDIDGKVKAFLDQPIVNAGEFRALRIFAEQPVV